MRKRERRFVLAERKTAAAKSAEKFEKEKLEKKRARIAKRIKTDLLHQLEQKKVEGAHYADLVDDYISLYEIKNKLIDDVSERGVKVKYQNGQNQFGYKKNDSVTELTRVNAQMLKLLADLGLKAAEFEINEDDDEL